MAEEQIGVVNNYFSRIGVAGIEVQAPFRRGDRLHFIGATTDFEQTVESLEHDNAPIEEARAGQQVGMKVSERVRPGDLVYRLS